METIVVTMMFVVLSALLAPSTSLQIQVQPSYEAAYENQHSPPAFPRKLRLFEIAVEGYKVQDLHSYKREEYVAGMSNDKEQAVVHGSKGTWQEWVEGADASEFFTMDYSKVKRRRPVHNKSRPVSP